MNVKLYSAANAELFDKLICEYYSANSSEFQPSYIIVENSATKDWLKYSLAKKVGIVANLQFKNTTEFIELVAKLLGIKSNNNEMIKPIQLNWLIYHIFGTKTFENDYPEISNYFKGNELKRFTLAEKVSTLFDRYQTLDSEIIKNWNNKEYRPDKSEEKWQCAVWRGVKNITSNLIPDKTIITDNILQNLNADNVNNLKIKLPQIAFFGQIEYTNDLIDLLNGIGEHIAVSIFHLDFTLATQSYNQNRLIGNFGSFMKSQKELFYSPKITPELITSKAKPKQELTLLTALQEQVLTGKGNKINIENDDSITINNCFSKNREVEVLYNYILKQFETNKDLGAKDICVMAPDINSYASAINAFLNKKDYEIKYSFYDSSFNIEESPFAALLALYNIEETNFTSEEVLSLIDYKYLREKFGFNEDSSIIRNAVSIANIRHGINGNQANQTNLVSWRYGLKRLIYGFCLKSIEEVVTIDETEFYPVDQFEGADTIELIRLNGLVEQLDIFLSERKNSKTLKDWIKFLEKNIDDFLNTSTYNLSHFYNVIGRIGATQDFIENEVIPFSVFKYQISSILNEMESGNKTGFNGVRFTSLQHFTSVPAKIYAFLGMNNSDFPRQQTRLSFDLTKMSARTVADLDKHLFLNCILSAENKLYLSYVGQSVKDNSCIPPSTVVSELISAIEPLLKTGCNIEKLITKHPLHSFSTRYNNESNLYHYVVEKPGKNIRSGKEEVKTNEDLSNEITINDLTRFLTDPFKWHYNKSLGVYYNEDNSTIPETELFELDNLQQWVIKDEIIKSTEYSDEEIKEIILEKTRKGILPLSETGAKYLFSINEEITELKNLVNDLFVGEESCHPINLPLGKYILSGNVDSIYNNNLIFVTVSADKHKYRLKSFIQYLALRASGINVGLYYIHKKSSEAKLINGISSEEAKEILEKWCVYYEIGQKKLLPFTTDFGLLKSKDLDPNNLKETDYDKFKINLNIIIQSYRHPYGGCYLSDYIKREIDTGFFENNENVDEFYDIYHDIIGILDNNYVDRKR